MGAAPPTRDSAPVEERFDVALRVEDQSGAAWEVRVAGRSLSGRAQSGPAAEGTARLVLLVFTREGAEAPEREALVAEAVVRAPDGTLHPDAVAAALAGAGPYRGVEPRADAFFDGTRRQRGR